MEEEYSQSELLSHNDIIRSARESMSDNWGLGAAVFLVMIGISLVAGIIPLLPLIIGGPLSVGMATWALNVSRSQPARVDNLFEGFQRFGTALLAHILMIIIVLFGMIALIIPGIIAALGLSMVTFIIADDPEIDAISALKKSWEIMDGHKMDYFLVMIRFIPWAILCVFTLFIGFFFLSPWVQVTAAKFYDYITADEHGEDSVLDHLTAD